MSFNNSVCDGRGNVLGFKCWECGEVVPSMWGETCNSCRAIERRHREIVKALRRGE